MCLRLWVCRLTHVDVSVSRHSLRHSLSLASCHSRDKSRHCVAPELRAVAQRRTGRKRWPTAFWLHCVLHDVRWKKPAMISSVAWRIEITGRPATNATLRQSSTVTSVAITKWRVCRNSLSYKVIPGSGSVQFYSRSLAWLKTRETRVQTRATATTVTCMFQLTLWQNEPRTRNWM